MQQSIPVQTFPIRKECPPGACDCQRDMLLNQPGADTRVLMLTQDQEKRLIERIGRIDSYDDLEHVKGLLLSQLGVILRIQPSNNEVRTMRGFSIQLEERPGLCKKTQKTIPAAIRKCLERHPEIAYAILNTHDLFG